MPTKDLNELAGEFGGSAVLWLACALGVAILLLW